MKPFLPQKIEGEGLTSPVGLLLGKVNWQARSGGKGETFRNGLRDLGKGKICYPYQDSNPSSCSPSEDTSSMSTEKILKLILRKMYCVKSFILYNFRKVYFLPLVSHLHQISPFRHVIIIINFVQERVLLLSASSGVIRTQNFIILGRFGFNLLIQDV